MLEKIKKIDFFSKIYIFFSILILNFNFKFDFFFFEMLSLKFWTPLHYIQNKIIQLFS
jgi:hypothetical protein